MTDINNPLSLIEVAIKAKTSADTAKLASALAALAAEDLSFRVKTDQESGQIILGGMSEFHLDDKLATLKKVHKIDVDVGAPQVAFLERITRRVEVAYTHKRQRGGEGEFAGVTLVVEPNRPGKGFAFESRIVNGAVLPQHIASIQKGVESVLGAGVVAGFPVVDVKMQLVDGKYHEIDSTALAFEIVARAAFRDALQRGRSVLLEPIMNVEVVTPDAYAGSIVDDLIRRRGEIHRRTPHGDMLVINATAPLMNMFGYAASLGEISRGRATFTMRFDHYADTPSPDDDPPFRPAVAMRSAEAFLANIRPSW